MGSFNANDLMGVLPALILSAGALVLMTSEVFLRADTQDRRYQAWLAGAFALLALWAALAQLGDPAQPIFSGAAMSDGFGRVVAATVSGSLLLSCLVAFGYLESLRATRGEFYALALFSASGMC